MAVRDTFVDVNDGDQLDDGFFNEIGDITRGRLKLTFTGTGFNSSVTNSGTDTVAATMTTISAADLTNLDYVEIIINWNSNLTVEVATTNNYSAVTDLKIETKNVGGSLVIDYEDVVNSLTFNNASNELGITGTINIDNEKSGCITLVHTLTASEKTDGLVIKITSSSTLNNNNGTAALINKGVWVKGLT